MYEKKKKQILIETNLKNSVTIVIIIINLFLIGNHINIFYKIFILQ